jgi:hypothetical protein
MTLEHRINKALRNIHDPERRALYREGIKEELEHSKTIRWAQKHPKATAVEVAKKIVTDHVDKDKKHYKKWKAVEEATAKPHHKLKSPRVKLIGRRGKIRIYRVDDTKARKLYSDWTMGGHSLCYPDMVAKNEVWIAGELGPPRPPLEEQLTMLHELREMRRMGELMTEGMSRADAYDKAHDESLVVEEKFRKAGGRGLKQALGRERGWQGGYTFPRA